MLKLIIEDDEGRKTVVPFMRDEITIGRQEGNTIRLTERNVSRHHARLVRQNGHVLVEDLGSYNGVRINGERIQEPAQVKDGDLIQIGDYDLALQQEAASALPIAPTVRMPAISEEEIDAARAQRDAEPEPEEDEESEPEEAASEAPPGDQRRHSTAVIRMDQVEMNRPRRVSNVDADDAPRLIVVSAEFKGQEFACVRTEMRVGRTDDNDIALDHRSLSRTHAKIVREESGEWRVIDMQSANGLSVNGESYAQASLAHGDLVELGHVKLRFIGPGQSADGLLHDAATKGSKKGLVLTLTGLVLLGAGAGAAWFFFNPPTPPPKPPPTVTDVPPQGTPPQQAQTPPPGTETPAVDPGGPPEPPTQVDTPPPAVDPFAEKIEKAKAAMAAHDFETAVTLLEPLKDAQGTRPPQVEAMLSESRGERDMKRSLDQASAELDANKLLEAQKSLAAAEGTLVYDTEYKTLRTRLDAALKAKAGTAPKPPPGPVRKTNPELAQTLLTEGMALLKEQKYKKAEETLKKCIEADPGTVDCYVWMGTTLARLERSDEGAHYYSEFLKRAPPNHAYVAKVRDFLAKYQKTKTPTGGGE